MVSTGNISRSITVYDIYIYITAGKLRNIIRFTARRYIMKTAVVYYKIACYAACIKERCAADIGTRHHCSIAGLYGNIYHSTFV